MKRIKIKTIICHMAIITICMGVFCHGYIDGASLSGHDRIHSYAEADNWSACDTSDLVTAFRYYCKSRNLAIEGSLADALTTFTTNTFNNICSTLGIDPTQLQAELKKTTEGNLGLRFLFSNTGITAYNRIFAEFLQNNNLAVGDEVEDDVVYSGEYYTYNGNSCLVYVIDLSPSNTTDVRYTRYDHILSHGSAYYYTYSQLVSMGSDKSVQSTSYNVQYSDNVTISFSLNHLKDSTSNRGLIGVSGYDNPIYTDGTNQYILNNNNLYGWLSVVKYANGTYHPCIFSNVYKSNNVDSGKYTLHVYSNKIENPETEPATVNITTNNTTINNNTYNNNYTIIYNEGDTYISDDDDEPLPTTPPGGGGGGGDNPTDPDNWDPTTPTIPDPSSPDFPSVDLPDIDIPDLPSLNFSLGDLRNKFPFSLPFDIIAVLNVLDGEPQAPHIEATVPIGKWYTWEMDFDFSEFDNYARIFRAFEFIGFCIGLAVFTVHFVKG